MKSVPLETAMAGRLTANVLDTMHGRPAAGLKISLFRVDGEHRRSLLGVQTNPDKRVDGALLEREDLVAGSYELDFQIGDVSGRSGSRRNSSTRYRSAS